MTKNQITLILHIACLTSRRITNVRLNTRRIVRSKGRLRDSHCKSDLVVHPQRIWGVGEQGRVEVLEAVSACNDHTVGHDVCLRDHGAESEARVDGYVCKVRGHLCTERT